MTLTRRKLAFAGVALLVVLAAGFDGSRQPASRMVTAGSHRVRLRPKMYRRPPVKAGRPGSAYAVLYRFAVTYGDLSLTDAQRRQAALVELAAPPLRSALVKAAPKATDEVRRGLGPGERMTATVASLTVGALVNRTLHAAVVIEQRQISDAGQTAAPVQTSYLAVLIPIEGQWRVSRFIPVS